MATTERPLTQDEAHAFVHEMHGHGIDQSIHSFLHFTRSADNPYKFVKGKSEVPRVRLIEKIRQRAQRKARPNSSTNPTE